jgi:hypothetical protein
MTADMAVIVVYIYSTRESLCIMLYILDWRKLMR